MKTSDHFLALSFPLGKTVVGSERYYDGLLLLSVLTTPSLLPRRQMVALFVLFMPQPVWMLSP